MPPYDSKVWKAVSDQWLIKTGAPFKYTNYKTVCIGTFVMISLGALKQIGLTGVTLTKERNTVDDTVVLYSDYMLYDSKIGQFL